MPQKMSVLEEEAIQTPLRTILKNFTRNRLGMIGLFVFIFFLLFAFLGSRLYPINLTYLELTNGNLPPGRGYLNVPKDLKAQDIKKIVSGVSFSFALKNDGTLANWGSEPNQLMTNVSDYVLQIPEEVKKANIVDIASGGKHILALDDQGIVHGWGYYGHGQTEIPADIQAELQSSGAKINQMFASTMWSAIVTSDKDLHVWGSAQATM
ncbi:MAG: hypothetical protein GX540_08900, partial [Clostridiales bacterium]|nr:hypothetical protein [Clostridiales bacterium]